MIFTEWLNNILRAVSSTLQAPVIIALILLILMTLFLLGAFAAETFTVRRKFKADTEELLELIADKTTDSKQIIENSGLTNSQKKYLCKLCGHYNFSQDMLEALALNIIDEQRSRYMKTVKITYLIAKTAPMLGLLGSLIPLGPGIIALGQCNTFALSNSLLTAFDTTVAGLVCAAVAVVISAVRKTWYAKYMSVFEVLCECICEKESKIASEHGNTAKG